MNWDNYFHKICEAVSYKSPCKSRKIGAILVRDHSVISTGFNGPPRGIIHCGEDRFLKDDCLAKELSKHEWEPCEILTTCPRRLLQLPSGEGLEWCYAQHAEINCLTNAARLGVCVINSILYMNCVIPCKSCFGALINAGVEEVVIDNVKVYDKHTQFIIDNSNIKIRPFKE